MKKVGWILALTLVFLFYLIPPTYASICSVSPEEIWIGKSSQISIDCNCPDGTYAETHDSISWYYPKFNNNKITMTLDDKKELRYGDYPLKIMCKNNTNTIYTEELIQIPIYDVSGKIISPKNTNITHIWDGSNLVINYRILENNQYPINKYTHFDIKIGGKSIVTGTPYRPNDEDFVIPIYDIKFEDLGNLNRNALHDLEVIATYQARNNIIYSIKNTERNVINLAQAFDITLISPRNEITLIDSGEIEISLKITFRGETLTNDHITNLDLFKASLIEPNTELHIKDIKFNQETNNWDLKIDIPQLSDNLNTDLQILLEYSGQTDWVKIPINKGLLFRGQIKKSNNEIVPTKFELTPKNSNTPIKFTTDNTGIYNQNITANTYDMTIIIDPDSSTRKIEVDIFEAELNSQNLFFNPLRFDLITEGVTFNDNINVAQLLIFEFGPKSKSATFKVWYDERRVTDELSLKVYECQTWQGGRIENKCKEWKEITNVGLNPAYNFVTFKTENIGTTAFAIGNQETLQLSATPTKNEFSSKEPVYIKGKVTDLKNNEIPNADVNYELLNTNINGITKTNENGEYSIKIEDIKTQGEHTLEIDCKKTLYSNCAPITTKFETKKMPKLTIIVPNKESPETIVTLDKESTIEFELENTGDLEITNIYFELENMPTNTFTLRPNLISSLSPGQKTNVKIDLKLTTKECNNKCSTYYNVNIKAKSDQTEIETTTSNRFPLKLVLEDGSTQLNQTQNQQTSTQTKETTTQTKETDKTPTGNILINHGETINIIILTTITIIALLIISKKKRKKNGQKNNFGSISKIKSLI
jgi:hypothetical protein